MASGGKRLSLSLGKHDMQIWLIIGLILIAVFVGVVVWRTRPKPTCPFCDSEKVREIGRNPAGVTTYQRQSGSDSGGTEVMVRTHTKIDFICEKCGKKFDKTVTQTR